MEFGLFSRLAWSSAFHSRDSRQAGFKKSGREHGQPCPRGLDMMPEARGHGCPRSNLQSTLRFQGLCPETCPLDLLFSSAFPATAGRITQLVDKADQRQEQGNNDAADDHCQEDNHDGLQQGSHR